MVIGLNAVVDPSLCCDFHSLMPLQFMLSRVVLPWAFVGFVVLHTCDMELMP